jgi:hypothetical protein
LLELLGKGYVIDHCVSFFQSEQKKMILTAYVTDALKAIVYNTGRHEDFIELQKSYGEVLTELTETKEEEISEEKTSEEIITDIRNRIIDLFY